MIAAVLAVLLGGAPPAKAPPAAPAELIVRFEAGATASERREAREDAGTRLERALPVRGMQLVETEAGASVSEAERALETQAGVLYAEPNVTRRAFLRPDDPYFGLLWGLDNTGQPIRGSAGTVDADSDVAEAWDLSVEGRPTVAVADSGVEVGHPDLAPNVWSNPAESGSGREANGVDDDGNGRVDDWQGWDFVSGDNDPADENGHGTHVAGTIGADRGNGLGVAGVVDGARLMPLRVLDAEGSGTVAGLIQAYSYAAASGARVVNLSLGSGASSRAERDAIASFPDVLFVAAAGNGGDDGIGDDNDASATFPCAYPLANVLCVAASDNNDLLAEFSNYGATSVDLAAPGVNIASSWPGATYSWSSGTSMATPHVAGAAALLWAAAPEASVAEIRSALLSGADAAQAFSGRIATGGRLNVLRSLRLVADAGLGSPAPAPPPGGSSGAAPEPQPAEPAPAAEPSSTPGVVDLTAPRLSVRARRLQSRGVLLRRGLVARVRCSEACTVRLALGARRRVLTATARTPLASDSASRRVRVRLTRLGRRVVGTRRVSSLTLVARATDRAGNTRTLRLPVRLSR